MTNGDKVRSMNNPELAEYLVSLTEYQESAWSQTNWATSNGGSYIDYNKAVLHELEWLNKEVE